MAKRKNQHKNQPAVAAKTGATGAGPDVMSPAQTIAWWCIHGLVLIVPLIMSNWTWLGFSLPLTYDQFDIIKVFVQRGLTLIALGAWSWHMLTKGGRLRRTKIDYVVLALLAWVLLTSILSIQPSIAFFGKYRRFEGFISFVNYAAIFFMVTQFADRASRIRSLARTLFFGGTLVSLYGMMQYIGIDPVKWGNLPFEANRAFSTYGNPDLLGGYLVFPLAISLALALSEENIKWRATYWMGFLITVACWIIAFTRGAWIGGTLAIILIIIVAVRHRIKLNVVDYSFVGAIGAVATGLVIVSLSAASQVMNVVARVVSIFDFGDASAASRFRIWQAAIDAIKDRPVFGFGADTFRLIFPQYKSIEYVQQVGYLSVADNVHNYPLQIASALGIPGFLLLYGTFAAAAWFSAPLVFRKHEGAERMVLAGFWAAAAGYLAHLMFGISVTGSSFLLWVAMAVVLSPLAKSVEIRAPRWGTPVAVTCLVLVAVLSVGNVVYITADNHYLKARVYSQGAARVAEIERAIALNPYNDMYRTELGVAHVDITVSLVTQGRELSAQGQNTDALKQQALVSFTKAEAALKEAIAFVPWEYDNYVFLANLYNLGADFLDPAYGEKAIAIAERGVEVEEYGPAIRFQLARALQRAGRTDEALEHIEFAVEMDPKYAEAVLLMANLYKETGRIEKAREAYELVLRRRPDYPGVQAELDALESSSSTP